MTGRNGLFSLGSLILLDCSFDSMLLGNSFLVALNVEVGEEDDEDHRVQHQSTRYQPGKLNNEVKNNS